MATQAGIGVLIGVIIGVAITYFFMQRTIRRQDNALQQSLDRLNRLQADHAQDLNAAIAKMETDYEQQLAAKIERYQDTHEVQLRELEAEYEARIAALTSVTPQADVPEAATVQPVVPPIESPEPPLTEPPSAQPVVQPATFAPLPDPWADPTAANLNPTTESAPAAKQPPQSQPSAPPRTQTVADLGKAAAMNRKLAVSAVPALGKLLKDSDADVRLAAINGLQASGSIKAIPFLRQALRDTDARVVAAASSALNRFKGTAKTPKSKAAKKKYRR